MPRPLKALSTHERNRLQRALRNWRTKVADADAFDAELSERHRAAEDEAGELHALWVQSTAHHDTARDTTRTTEERMEAFRQAVEVEQTYDEKMAAIEKAAAEYRPNYRPFSAQNRARRHLLKVIDERGLVDTTTTEGAPE